MKIFIICSKAFYDKIKPIKEYLENNGWEVFVPHTYLNPSKESETWQGGEESHSEFKARMFRLSEERIKSMDAVLVLNYERHGIKNYIGGSTFLEMYEAFRNNKKIYMMNPIPEGLLFDEIDGFSPVIINSDLELIK